MSKGKLIHCRCHEPIGLSKEAQQPWSDVWIRYTDKPGRKKVCYGPTLVSKGALKRDLDFEREFQAENPEYADEKEIREMEEVLRRLENEPVVIGDDWQHGTPTIYTANELIDRKTAEQMLSAMMAGLRFQSVRFKWKRPKFVVRPMG